MLDTDWVVSDDRVEETPVERAGNRLVVPDAPQPAVLVDRRGGLPQLGGKGGPIPNRRRPAPHRPARGGDGNQMNVMIVKSRQKGPAMGLNDRVLVARWDVAFDLSDSPAADLHVDRGVAVDLGSDNQDIQVCHHLFTRFRLPSRRASGSLREGRN
jgi:hypothetical protein